MREILFRGKRVDNGKWVEGELLHDMKSRPWIYWTTPKELPVFFSKNAIVTPETIGQYTGLTDKNGRRIFEGDIVCIRYRNGEICCIGDVQFSHGVYGAEWLGTKKNKSMVGGWGQLHNLRRFDDDIINDIEVIGNIYDNPELLEDEE